MTAFAMNAHITYGSKRYGTRHDNQISLYKIVGRTGKSLFKVVCIQCLQHCSIKMSNMN